VREALVFEREPLVLELEALQPVREALLFEVNEELLRRAAFEADELLQVCLRSAQPDKQRFAFSA